MSVRGVATVVLSVAFSAWVASRVRARWACKSEVQTATEADGSPVTVTDPDTGEVFTLEDSDYGGACKATPPVPLFVAIGRAARARFASKGGAS